MGSTSLCETTPIRPAHATGAKAAPTVRVLHVINGEHYAGAERVQDYLALRLPAYGFDVEFACVKPGRFEAIRQARQAVLHDVPMRGRCDLRPVRRIDQTDSQPACAIVHTHSPRTALVGGLAATLTGVPLVHHAHSPASNDSTRRWLNRINAVIERVSLHGVSRVIAVSDAIGRHVAGKGFARRGSRWCITACPRWNRRGSDPRRPAFGRWA